MERTDGSVATRSPEFAGVLFPHSLSRRFTHFTVLFFSFGRLIVVSVFKMDPAFTENEAANE